MLDQRGSEVPSAKEICVAMMMTLDILRIPIGLGADQKYKLKLTVPAAPM